MTHRMMIAGWRWRIGLRWRSSTPSSPRSNTAPSAASC